MKYNCSDDRSQSYCRLRNFAKSSSAVLTPIARDKINAHLKALAEIYALITIPQLLKRIA